VAGMYRRVPVTVEDDQRQVQWWTSALVSRDGWRAPPHRCEGGTEVLGGPAGQPGMYADRGIQVGIGRAHDRGHGPAGRHPRDVDALRINLVGGHHLLGDAGDQRRLALAAALVSGLEPVPAA